MAGPRRVALPLADLLAGGFAEHVVEVVIVGLKQNDAPIERDPVEKSSQTVTPFERIGASDAGPYGFGARVRRAVNAMSTGSFMGTREGCRCCGIGSFGHRQSDSECRNRGASFRGERGRCGPSKVRDWAQPHRSAVDFAQINGRTSSVLSGVPTLARQLLQPCPAASLLG